MAENRRALISVTDKQGVVEFARGLVDLGFEVVSTGGTMKALAEGGVKVTAVSDVTGVPEILGGRVKTLHPAIFAGVLAQRQQSEDLRTLEDLGIGKIDVVAVNLYAFEQTVARLGATDAEIVENIDIGGPSLLRAAAKNHRDVYAVADPADYDDVLASLGEERASAGGDLRRRLAAKVFDHCSSYDRAISTYLQGSAAQAGAETEADAGDAPPEALNLSWPLRQRLRYGENPHQAAAFYADPNGEAPSLAHCRQIHGKELSYNNFLDGEGALEMIRDFTEPTAVILKHANPCGVGRADTLAEAYERALRCDSLSAFGGIVGLNRPVDPRTAKAMSELFLEVIIAPSFEPEALEILSKKKNVRLLEAGELSPRPNRLSYRSVVGGMLAQASDCAMPGADDMQVVTKAKPSDEDFDALLFAWKIVRWVRSNAIIFADGERTLGIGAGQMSRIDAARFALQKADGAVQGAYVASDGFFPFRDVVDLVAEAGVRAIIQPGGSIRDKESIEAADERGLIMVLTGQRVFRH